MTAVPPAISPVTVRAPGYAGAKRNHLNRLTKVEGQVRGIARWWSRTCIEVLTQIAAVTKAL